VQGDEVVGGPAVDEQIGVLDCQLRNRTLGIFDLDSAIRNILLLEVQFVDQVYQPPRGALITGQAALIVPSHDVPLVELADSQRLQLADLDLLRPLSQILLIQRQELSLNQCKQKGRHKLHNEFLLLTGDTIHGLGESIEDEDLAHPLADDVALVVEELHDLLGEIDCGFLL
jgi:hypothetical protein